MQVKPDEIEKISTVGDMNGSPVKMVKCFGGWYFAVGAKSKNSKEVSPIAAGSHPALVLHQISKEFKGDFKPAMMKSEGESEPLIKEFTKKLPLEMVEKGFQVFSLVKNNDVNFIATKHGAEVVNFSGYIISDKVSDLKKVTSIASEKDTAKICSVIAEALNGK